LTRLQLACRPTLLLLLLLLLVVVSIKPQRSR